MKNSLAIWHYPYRTPTENVLFFAKQGFPALSQHGLFFLSSITGAECAAFTEAIRTTGIRFTVHHMLPYSGKNYTPAYFAAHIRAFRKWQDDTGLLWNLSFDVFPENRPHASEYIRFVLDIFRGTDTRITVEDYGLSPDEQADLEEFRSEPRFGYLIDLGHMNVRLHNTGTVYGHAALNQHGEAAPLLPGDASPEAFRTALENKTFPIYEYHLHNNSGYGDEHRYLEEGSVDMKGLAAVLRSRSDDFVCTMEIVPDWTGTPEEAAAQKAFEQEYWTRLEADFTLPEFRGKPDPARDARALRSWEFWKACLDSR